MPKVGRAQIGFDDFRVLRAIGRGAFGKVCIVEKRNTKQMYAMKYMSKAVCIEKDAVRNVLREMDILMGLDHSFLVNLWFTFQDEEDFFVVVDLLLGGDFRYHLQQGIKFNEDVVKFYVAEIAMALDYLKSQRIIHRDIKPDNLLLDIKGHVHLTDFNVATVMEDENTLATSLSGTKPYMAPEIFQTSLGKSRGYSYAVDWWSLGISIFEMLRGKRPYHISSTSKLTDIMQMFESSCLMFPTSWSKNIRTLIRKLLHIDPKVRLDSVEKLKEYEVMQSLDWESLYKKEITIPFIPSKDHLNCDPTYELEEMIIEPNPLHKKKKRLEKKNSNKVDTGKVELSPMQMKLDSLGKQFKPYNREREKLLREQKNRDNFDEAKIPEEDENLEVVDVKDKVELKDETQPGETGNITCKEEENGAVVVEGAVKQPETEVQNESEFEQKGFENEKERLIVIAEQAKIKDTKREENEEVENVNETKELNVEDKETLLQNEVRDPELRLEKRTSV